MFGIGMPELIVIFIVALLVIGPKKLPEFARSLGKGLQEFKRAADGLRESLKEDLGLDEVRRAAHDAFSVEGEDSAKTKAAGSDYGGASTGEGEKAGREKANEDLKENSPPGESAQGQVKEEAAKELDSATGAG